MQPHPEPSPQRARPGIAAAVCMPDGERTPVVVLDGRAAHGEVVAQALAAFYRVVSLQECRQAMQAVADLKPAVLIVDEDAPPLGGPEMVRKVRGLGRFAHLQIVATSSNPHSDFIRNAASYGADVGLPKPFRRSLLLHVVSSRTNRAVEARWQGLAPQHRDSLRATLAVFNGISDMLETSLPVDYAKLSAACDLLVAAVTSGDYRPILTGIRDHDNYTFAHSLRVAVLLILFGHAIGLNGHDLTVLAGGGLLADIGKMFIPPMDLNKPGPLDDDERGAMRDHVALSVRHVARSPDIPRGIMSIVAHHHERLDGSGYPDGLTGNRLDSLARMAAIVDVFAALTDRRCYRAPVSAEQALKTMTDDMAGQLDGHLIRLFTAMLLGVAGA